ncbi:MAG: transposase [Elainellaceae cyanobacterium]
MTDWGRQMLYQVRRWVPERSIVLVSDSSFAAFEFLSALAQMPNPVHVVTRLRLDTERYDPPPVRRPKQMGRPRKVGRRLPALKALVNTPYTPWQSVTMTDWYSRGDYGLQITSATALWYKTGMPAVPIRWVLIRDPKGNFETQVLLYTNLSATPEQILYWFRQRWQLEVIFEEVQAYLGVETQCQGSSLAIARTTPVFLGLF